MAEPKQDVLNVHVVWMDAGKNVLERAIQLSAGSTVAQALNTCQLTLTPSMSCGIWGRVTALDQILRDNDRVEIYHPLKVDPKVARRERFAKQGARGAGLFSARRPNSKAGY